MGSVFTMARTKNSSNATELVRERALPAKIPRDAASMRRILPQPVAPTVFDSIFSRKCKRGLKNNLQ